MAMTLKVIVGKNIEFKSSLKVRKVGKAGV